MRCKGAVEEYNEIIVIKECIYCILIVYPVFDLINLLSFHFVSALSIKITSMLKIMLAQ